MSYETALLEIARLRDDVVVLTAENRAHIRGLADALGPRFVDVGIAEQTLLGAAAGLALRGRRPVVHALAAFLTMRAFEFVRSDVALGGLPVLLVGYLPGFQSEANGPTHQALEDLALMRTIPGMDVFCPADEKELEEALPDLLSGPRPCYVRHTSAAPSVAHAPFARGEAEVLLQGSDVALLVSGPLLGEALQAARRLGAEGVSVHLVNVRMLEPLDRTALAEAACRTRLIVTIEDHFRRGGLYSAVVEALNETGPARTVVPVALEQRWFEPLLLPPLLAHEGFDAAALVRRVHSALRSLAPPEAA